MYTELRKRRFNLDCAAFNDIKNLRGSIPIRIPGGKDKSTQNQCVRYVYISGIAVPKRYYFKPQSAIFADRPIKCFSNWLSEKSIPIFTQNKIFKNSTHGENNVMNELTASNILKSPNAFNDKLIDIIPFVDPDSTRFMEWIWAVRHAAGLSTDAAEFEIPSNVHVDFDALKEPLRERFKTVYNSNYYFRGIRNNEETGIPDFFAVIGQVSGRPLIVVAGDKVEVDEVMEFYKSKYVAPNVINIHSLIGFAPDGTPQVKKTTLLENEVTIANDAFYPWIEEGLDKFVEDYEKSKASVLVLIGDPGLGKSTMLRTLLFKSKRDNIHTASNEVVLQNPSLSNWLEATGEKPIIAIEDADNLVAKRSNQNYQMSMLLNFTDGVINNGVKMIISTNLATISKIDEALTRKGRAYKILHFRKLTCEEANKARESIGLDAIDFPDSITSMSLAEALNYTDESEHGEHKAPAFGLNQSK